MLQVVTQFLGHPRLRFAEHGEVDVHLRDRHRNGDKREMHVIACLCAKAIDKFGAVVHLSAVDAGG